MLKDTRELVKEEGDVIREYKAMHEENSLSSWLREDGKEKEERKKRWAKRGGEKRRKKRTRRGRLKDDVSVPFLWRPLISSVKGDLESSGGLYWRDLLEKPEDLSDCETEARVDVSVVPDEADVLVSLSSVTEFCDGFSFCSGWEFVEPQSFAFSRKRAHSWTVTQEEMRFEGSQVKAPPPSRRRMMLPTPLQNSCSSFEEEQELFEVEDQIWSARDRTVIARTKQYLEESKSLKVVI